MSTNRDDELPPVPLPDPACAWCGRPCTGVDEDGDPACVRGAPGTCARPRVPQSGRGHPARVYEHAGRVGTVAQWAARLGVKRRVLDLRLARGWSVAQTLETPVAHRVGPWRGKAAGR